MYVLMQVFDDLSFQFRTDNFRFRSQVRLSVEVDKESGDDSQVEYPYVVEYFRYRAVVEVQVA